MKRGATNALMRGGKTYIEWAAEIDREGKKELKPGRTLNVAKGFARITKAQQWAKDEHDYYLVYGDKPTGDVMRVTGREAAMLNKGFEKKFIAQLDAKQPGARLYRWLVKRG